jgi:long-chain fatty acid transport protein
MRLARYILAVALGVGILPLPVFAAAGLQVPAIGGIFEGPSVVSPLGVYWNPAAIGLLKGTQLYGAFSPTFAYGSFSRSGIDPNIGMGFDKASWFGFGPVPTAVATSDFGTKRVVVGLGVYVPFGAAADYGPENLYGPQRYHLQSGQMFSLFTTPTVSVRVSDNFFIGAGVSWVHTRSTSGLSYDLAAALSNAGVSPEAAGTGLEDPLLEAYVDTGVLQGNSFAWDLGVLWQPTPQLDLGLSYRSEVKVSLSGSADVMFPLFPPEVGDLLSLGPVQPGSEQQVDVSQSFHWPMSIQAGATYRFLPRWTGIGTAQWTNWSRLNEYRITIDTPPLSGSALDLSRAKGLRDSIFLSGAALYDLTKDISVGGRLAFDSAAVPKNFMNPQNQDYWTLEVGVGAKYRFARRFLVGFDYLHQFFIPRSVDGSVFDPRDPTRSGFNYTSGNGGYSADVDKFDLSFSAEF